MKKSEETVSILESISNLKKDLLVIRIKSSSGEEFSIGEYRSKKKEIARLFTKLNNKK